MERHSHPMGLTKEEESNMIKCIGTTENKSFNGNLPGRDWAGFLRPHKEHLSVRLANNIKRSPLKKV
uniref:Uncharacterized protein n=1 Tax=Romanomermis culicivorax TaxID=13658 RepID=A0A915I2B9_ROMCU